MSIKYRIAILVTVAGFIASLLFSLVVFYELIEQPFEILDMELKEEANRAVNIIKINQGQSESEIMDTQILEFPTWLKIFENNSDRELWHSKAADQIGIPTVNPGPSATVDAVVLDDEINFGQDSDKKAAFRTRSFELMAGGKKVRVQVALPMVKLKNEIHELIFGLIAGLIFSTLVLIVISYFVAGKILKPIGRMKDLAHSISAKNLDQRIPVKNGKDEFNELARTVNVMLDRLQFSFVRQRDFLFDTSHELKTPLTTIRLALDAICSSEYMEKVNPSSKESLLRVNEQVARMEKLVRDLLNLSSLEILNKIDPEPVNLKKILLFLIEDYQILAAAKNIHIDVSSPEDQAIRGDKEKIKRALSNILDNAIKYNVDGGRVQITVSSTDTEVTVVIANTGPGIPEDEIPKVFDQFYRAEKSRSAGLGGSGLGLTIVKRIIELHGGKVSFNSRPGDLTWVTVKFSRPG